MEQINSITRQVERPRADTPKVRLAKGLLETLTEAQMTVDLLGIPPRKVYPAIYCMNEIREERGEPPMKIKVFTLKNGAGGKIGSKVHRVS